MSVFQASLEYVRELSRLLAHAAGRVDLLFGLRREYLVLLYISSSFIVLKYHVVS
jgi:hypothetical protein